MQCQRRLVIYRVNNIDSIVELSSVAFCLAPRMVRGLACSARDREDETSWDQFPAAAFFSLRNILKQDIHTKWLRSTQPFIASGSINRVPASTGVMAGTSPLSGGR